MARVLTAPFFRFHRLVALFQWSKYKNSIFDHFSAINSQAVALSTPPGSQWAIICPSWFWHFWYEKKHFL